MVDILLEAAEATCISIGGRWNQRAVSNMEKDNRGEYPPPQIHIINKNTEYSVDSVSLAQCTNI